MNYKNLLFVELKNIKITKTKTLSSTECMLIASLVAQMVKNLPVMQETWVQSLGLEDPLKEEVATHASILACRIPETEESGGLQSMGLQRVEHH